MSPKFFLFFLNILFTMGIIYCQYNTHQQAQQTSLYYDDANNQQKIFSQVIIL